MQDLGTDIAKEKMWAHTFYGQLTDSGGNEQQEEHLKRRQFGGEEGDEGGSPEKKDGETEEKKNEKRDYKVAKTVEMSSMSSATGLYESSGVVQRLCKELLEEDNLKKGKKRNIRYCEHDDDGARQIMMQRKLRNVGRKPVPVWWNHHNWC